MTIVDIDGFFWRAEIYPKNKIDLSRPENPRRHLEGVEILEEIFILYQKKYQKKYFFLYIRRNNNIFAPNKYLSLEESPMRHKHTS